MVSMAVGSRNSVSLQSSFLLGLAVVFFTGRAVGGTSDPAVRPIEEVRGIPLAEVDLGVRVRVNGVITFRDVTNARRTITVQDNTAGTWVEVSRELPEDALDALQVGVAVDVQGILDPGGFAPRILASGVEVLGARPLPAPLPADIDRLFSGADNCLRVTLPGVVQAYHRGSGGPAQLIIASESRRLAVRVPDTVLGDAPDRLIDARVAVTGIVTATRNTRGEFLRPGLNVALPEDVVVVEPPPGGPFDSREIPLEAIARFRPEPNRGHRIRTRGKVTASFPGRCFYLQSGFDGVRVQTRSRDPIERGDQVDVAGFLDMSRGTGALSEAVYRTGPRGAPVRPVPIQPTEIIATNVAARREGEIAKPGSYAGCLIEFTAKHVESHPPYDGWCRMTLMDGPTVFTALLPEEAFPTIDRITPGSVLRGTGVADLKTSADEGLPVENEPAFDRVDVLIQTAADLTIVSVPSWWTPRRLGYALAATVGGLGVSLGVIQILRRQIMNQAARLADEIRSSREAAVEFQAALRERNRLASNLHDTVLQTVTGVGFQLQACRTVGANDAEDSASHLKIAERMVDHAVQQLRGTVWALHTVPTEGQSLSTAVHALVDRLSAGHAIKIEARTDGAEYDVPEAVAGNLLLVAQEAIHNALQHAHATIIDVKVTFRRDGTVAVTVRDDGVGFEAGAEPGSSQGHFGLEGMHDRMKRIGGSVRIESEVGGGTSVTAVVPPEM